MKNLKLDIGKLDFEKVDGMIPAIIQDTESATVLMLGYQNKEAIEKSLKEGKMTFFSRTKNRLWTKGEESGNFLEIMDVAVDCDKDTLLWKVKAPEETCHAGTFSCFGEGEMNLCFLKKLTEVIHTQRTGDPETSYVARMFGKGLDKIAQKVGEEAVETVIAAKNDDDGEFRYESADLLFHLLLLCEARNVSFEAIVKELKRRHKKREAEGR